MNECLSGENQIILRKKCQVVTYILCMSKILALCSFRNIIHGSDSVESANKEIDLWFLPEELIDWQPACEAWVYED